MTRPWMTVTALALVLCPFTVSALFYTQREYSTDCFEYEVQQNDDLVGSFEIQPPLEGFEVTIEGKESKEMLAHFRRRDEAQIRVQATHTQAGKAPYTLCFKSSASVPSIVSFHLRTSSHLADQPATTDHASKLKNTMQHVEQKVEELDYQLEYTMVREELHRNVSEKTNERVLWWTLSILVAILVISMLQVYYVKSLFEVKTLV